MLISDIKRLFNTALAGDTLSLNEMIPHLDFAIDGINATLNAAYPAFSELDLTKTDAVYNYFPDKYIRTVIIPGAAWHYYVTDEEGLQSSPQYQLDFEQGKFKMQRDMLYNIPLEYQADVQQGSILGDPDCYTLGVQGLECDLR